MPMSFPTLESLVCRAGSRNFRPLLKDETEAQYRQAFHQFMQYVDCVEASEIRSGAGWDQQDPASLLSSFFNRQDTTPMYVWSLAILKVESPITSIVIDESKSSSKEKLQIQVEQTLLDQYSLDEDTMQYTDLCKKYSELPFDRIHVVAEPKEFENIAYKGIVGQYVDLWRHKLTGALYVVIPNCSYATFEATPNQMLEFAETGTVSFAEPEYMSK